MWVFSGFCLTFSPNQRENRQTNSLTRSSQNSCSTGRVYSFCNEFVVSLRPGAPLRCFSVFLNPWVSGVSFKSISSHYPILSRLQGLHRNWERKFHDVSVTFSWLLNQFHGLKIDKRTNGKNEWNSPWLYILMLDTKFLKLFTVQPSAKTNYGKNLKFHDFSMTQTNFSNFQDFSRPRMQISNSIAFHDFSMTVEPCSGFLIGSHKHPSANNPK